MARLSRALLGVPHTSQALWRRGGGGGGGGGGDGGDGGVVLIAQRGTRADRRVLNAEALAAAVQSSLPSLPAALFRSAAGSAAAPSLRTRLVDRDHELLRISATFTYGGGHFSHRWIWARCPLLPSWSW